MTKFGSWHDVSEVVAIVQDINRHELPQILVEVSKVSVDAVLELWQQSFLEALLLVQSVNIHEVWLELVQRIVIRKLIALFLLLVAYLFLRLKEHAHLELSKRKLTFRVLRILLGIHGLLEVDELTSLLSSDIHVAVTHLALGLRGNYFDLDMVIALRVLEVAEVLEIAIGLDALVIVLGEVLHLELAVGVQSAILDLQFEVVVVIVGAVPVVQVVEVDVDDFDVEVGLGVDLGVLELMEVIVDDFFGDYELVLDRWNDILSPMSVVKGGVG